MNKAILVAIGLFVVLLVSVVVISSLEQSSLTAHAVSRLEERTYAHAKGSKTTGFERSARTGSRTWEGSGSSGDVDITSGSADGGYAASSTSAPKPTSPQKR